MPDAQGGDLVGIGVGDVDHPRRATADVVGHQPVHVGVVPEQPCRVIGRDLEQVSLMSVRRHHEQHVVGQAGRRHVHPVVVQVAGVRGAGRPAVTWFGIRLVEDDAVGEGQVEVIARADPKCRPGEAAVVGDRLQHSAPGERHRSGRGGDCRGEDAADAGENRGFGQVSVGDSAAGSRGVRLECPLGGTGGAGEAEGDPAGQREAGLEEVAAVEREGGHGRLRCRDGLAVRDRFAAKRKCYIAGSMGE
jgi:hypothetical protein